MRKIFLTLTLLFIFSLCGCSRLDSSEFTDNDKVTSEPATDIFTSNDIEILKSWSFQFNEETNDYSVFFGLLNKIMNTYLPMLMLTFGL